MSDHYQALSNPRVVSTSLRTVILYRQKIKDSAFHRITYLFHRRTCRDYGLPTCFNNLAVQSYSVRYQEMLDDSPIVTQNYIRPVHCGMLRLITGDGQLTEIF